MQRKQSVTQSEDGTIFSNRYYRIKNRGESRIAINFNAEKGNVRYLEKNEAFGIKGSTILDKNMNVEETIKELETQGILTVRDLGLVIGKNYIIRNKTARRIGICPYEGVEPLVLPAFGSRVLSSDFLRDFDILPWVRQSLVTIDSASQRVQNETILSVIGLAMIGFVLFLAVSIPLAFFIPNSIPWKTIGIVSVISVIVLLLSLLFAERLENIGKMGSSLINWLKLFPGIALVLMMGIGLPLGAVYFFGGGSSLFLLSQGDPASLGRLMQITFITIASILPALLYYLFGRMQVEKQRDTFFREVILLDPNVQSYSEAEDKYEPLMQSVYGSGNSPFAILLLVISTILLVMGWIMTISPIKPLPDEPGNLISYFSPHPTPFILGFLGAYFFAINMIFRRYVRSDLTPKTYAYINVRLLVTMVLVWAVGTLPQFSIGSIAQTGLLALCFIIGIFPDTGLAVIKDAFQTLTRSTIKDYNEDNFPLSDLEGMNLYDRARMLEEGIENIENLAHHDLVELIARTRIPTSRLLDMFDQAILYMHIGIGDQRTLVGKPSPKDDGVELFMKLKSYGIRTATDLIDAFDGSTGNIGKLEDAIVDEAADNGKAAAIAKVARLKVIVDSFRGEEWLSYIRNWDTINKDDEPITEPYDFYKEKDARDAVKPAESTNDGKPDETSLLSILLASVQKSVENANSSLQNESSPAANNLPDNQKSAESVNDGKQNKSSPAENNLVDAQKLAENANDGKQTEASQPVNSPALV